MATMRKRPVTRQLSRCSFRSSERPDEPTHPSSKRKTTLDSPSEQTTSREEGNITCYRRLYCPFYLLLFIAMKKYMDLALSKKGKSTKKLKDVFEGSVMAVADLGGAPGVQRNPFCQDA